ncbi:hypothetical protein LTR28_007188, partial [Elasticomyces elasticus]
MAGLAALSLSFLSASVSATCYSYGMDFQNGGTYFQNISSSAPFTFDSQFEGCAVDVANNVLVDPNGNQYQCSDTNLTPDDTDQLSTCDCDNRHDTDHITSTSTFVDTVTVTSTTTVPSTTLEPTVT